MEALRRQASKLREQVAKQQQAVIKQFGGTGYESSDVMVIDELEMQRHLQLEKLYRSTRAGKEFQKDIVRAAEAFTAIGHKHIETGMKLSEDCFKYGSDNIASDEILAKAASLYGGALVNIEKEQEDFIRVLSLQIIEPLKTMTTAAPLEDARHLAQRYSRMRHEAESLAAEISRRHSRVRESPILEHTSKLQSSESKLLDLKANMAILGREAAASLAAVESQQQRLTLQRLVALIEAEKSFYLRIAALLDDVQAEMVSEKQKKDSAPPLAPSHKQSEKILYFLAEAMYAFSSTSEKELNLSVGDYVVVRQISSNPGIAHWKAAKKILRYLKRTRNHMLTYRRSNHLQIVGYSDSNFGGCPNTRHCTLGYVYLLARGAISWKSQKSELLYTSTMEVEFVACFEASNQGS